MLMIYHDGFVVCFEQCLKKRKVEMIIQPAVSNHFL